MGRRAIIKEKLIERVGIDLSVIWNTIYRLAVLIRHLNINEKNRLKIISFNEFVWLRYYKELWINATNNEEDVDAEEYEGNIDFLTMDELDVALKRCVKKKAVAYDG